MDQVRALRDEAIYAPANVKKRVYIVDEVHMLSTAAFNALLKILEEPPAHLMFILATTELHKVPATILSRCQRYSFKRILPKDIAQRLTYVAGQEHIDLTADGAELLSRLADGALRDGLSLLDQCAAAGGTVDSRAVLEVLGLAGNLQTAQLMRHILDRNVQAALLLLNELYAGGKDVGAVLGELSTLTRDLLLRKTAPEGGAALLSGGFDSATLDQLGKDVPSNRFLYLASTLQKAAADLYYSADRRTDAELCLLRLCDESLCGDLTALENRITRLEDAVARRRGDFRRRESKRLAAKTSGAATGVGRPRQSPRQAPRETTPPNGGPAPVGRTAAAGGAAHAGGARRTGLRHSRGCRLRAVNSPYPPSGADSGSRLRSQRRQKAACRLHRCQRKLVARPVRELQGAASPHVPGVSGFVRRHAGGRPDHGLCPG